ncbi:MAG: alpha/beta hydrolase [Gammaproteobacteria bacterium]|nr:alpha/beta hydrolase [Gammaproteobacteria bacterium]
MSRINIEEFKVDITGANVYVRKWTPIITLTDSPIFLLHDSLGCVDLWKDFPSFLAEKLSRPVIAYDRLGFGQSDPRDELPSIEFIAEEAIKYFPAIKHHLSIQHYALLGHSVGGGMAINIAARDPDCEAVITVSAQAFVEDLTIKGIEDAKKNFEQPGQLSRLEKWHGSKAAWVLRAWTDVWLSAEFANWSLQPSIGKVRCPVLAIHGENDQYGSSAFVEFISKNTAGHSSMLLLKNCGHIPHKEQPQAVLGAMQAFFR